VWDPRQAHAPELMAELARAAHRRADPASRAARRRAQEVMRGELADPVTRSEPEERHVEASERPKRAVVGDTLARRPGSAAEVLARPGDRPDAAHRVAASSRALEEAASPAEVILLALRDARAGEPALVDAWADERAIIVAELELEGRRIALRLGAPAVDQPPIAAGGLVDYLQVVPIAPVDPPAELLLACLRLLGRLPLPPPASWAADRWFDQEAARNSRSAWRRLGGRLWPGFGSFGPWRTRAVSLAETREVLVALEHATGAEVQLRWRARPSVGRGLPEVDAPMVEAHFQACGSPLEGGALDGLLGAVGTLVAGRPVEAPRFGPLPAGGTLAARCDAGRWTLPRDGGPALPGRRGGGF
jgi:hypothetical protein